MIFENLMNNSYIWATLSLITVFAFIFEIYNHTKGKRKKSFTCYKNYCVITENGKGSIPELRLTYKNKEISDLTITKFAVWNHSNKVINWSDMVEAKALRITSDSDNTEILDAKILFQSDETNAFKIKKVDSKNIILTFDYVEDNDGFVLQVLHTGESSHLSVSCKIKGGKAVKELGSVRNTKKSSQSLKVRKRVDIVSLSLLIVVLIFYTVLTSLMIITVILKFSVFESISEPISACVFAVVLTLSMFALVIMQCRIMKKRFGLDIPSNLRCKIINDGEAETPNVE
ncbi:MAG: hypothetical protein K1V97_03135 [Lachnospiraceae bacterium]